jgi:hypothetical protein
MMLRGLGVRPIVVSALMSLLALAGGGAPRRVAPHAAATFVVNSIGDASDAVPGDGVCDAGAGVCTFRAAVEEANANAGADSIHFSIGTGAKTIAIGGPGFAEISEAVTIDGTTQPGYAGVPLIELDGAASPVSLTLGAGAAGSTVRGLLLNRFPFTGLNVNGNGNTVEQCYVGTDATRTQDRGNLGDGIAVTNASSNLIRNNVVAFNHINGVGVYDGSTGGYPLFTALTPDATLTVPTIDFQDGCGAFRHGNNPPIIDTSGRTFTENFGMRLTATLSVSMSGSYHFDLTQLDDNARLLVDAVEYLNVNGNGHSADVALSAGDHAFELDYAEGGGAASLVMNISGPGTATFNSGLQAELFQLRTPAEQNTISQNSIFDNGGQGIALGCCCFDTNDAGDIDPGPNTFLNYPVFVNRTVNGDGTVTINGTATPGATVELFASTNDNGNHGEGKLYLGSALSTGTFTATITLPQPYYSVTATATDTIGNTSELAQNFVVRPRPIVVTNANDSGSGSLRAAIGEANSDGVESLITFDPSLTGASIPVNTPLPILTENGTTINADGNSDCAPDVELRGNGPVPTGLTVHSSGNTIRGLAINRFGSDDVVIEGPPAQNNHVTCNHLGLNLAGTSGFPPPALNGAVIRNGAMNNTVDANKIGGLNAAGILIQNADANLLINNTIGLIQPPPTGVQTQNANGVAIGNPGNGNRVVATTAGIDISGGNNVTVDGNTVGWPTGITPSGDGIVVRDGATQVRVGNLATNHLENNGGAGVRVSGQSTDQVTIRNNAISGNGGLGIDLDGNGVTPNDGNPDADNGANEDLNFPLITRTAATGTSTQVEGFLDTSPGTYDIEIYDSAAADPSGYGEGAARVFSASIAPGPFNFLLPPVPAGSYLTAIAIDAAGNTSEFSLAKLVSGPPLAASELVAFPGTPSGIELRWRDPQASETGFRIERQGFPNWFPLTTVGPDVTAYLDNTAPPGSTQSYRVVATAPGGDAPPSNVAVATAYSVTQLKICRTQENAQHQLAAAPSVAFDGTNWAMAWADQRNGRAADIFFQQLDADGAPAGSAVQITNDDVPSTSPTLVWNGSAYGLLWLDHLRGPNGQPTAQLTFALLNASGTRIRGDVRVTSTRDAAPPNPDGAVPLLWDGGGWGTFAVEANNSVVFYRFDPDGDLLVNGALVIQTPHPDGSLSAAWNGSQYAVVWVQETNPFNPVIRFARVQTNGNGIGVIQTFNTGGPTSGTSVIADGAGWAAAWSTLNPPSDTAVSLIRLDGNGNQLAPPARVSDNAPTTDTTPKLVAKPGGGYLIYTTTGAPDIGRLQADAAGQRVGSRTLVSPSDGFASAMPRVAGNGTSDLVAWTESRLHPSEIADAVVSTAGAVGLVNDVTTTHLGDAASAWPSVLPFQDGFVTVWREASGQVHARIHRANGTFSDRRPLNGANTGRKPALARGYGNELAVAWTDRTSNGVHFDRLDQNGFSLIGGVRIANADVDKGVGLDFSGELWGVVWVDGGQLRFQRMGNNVPIGTPTIIPGFADAEPQIQWIGSGWAVMWTQNQNLMFARLDAAGALLVPPASVAFGAVDFQLLFTGQHLGATWSDDFAIHFTVLDANGIKQFAPVTATNTPYRDRYPAMYFDGVRFHILYPDFAQGLRDVQMMPNGSLVTAQFLGNHGGEGRVAAATNGATTAMAFEHQGDILMQTNICLNDVSPPGCVALNGSFASGAIQLNWPIGSDPQSGILAHHLYRDGKLLTELSPSTGSYSDTGFVPAQAYTYELRPYNGAYLEAAGCTPKTVTAGILISPATLPNGRQSSAYNQTFSASQGTGPYVFDVTSGALPPGLILEAGQLSGTPTGTGLFTFTITATDSLGATGVRNYQLRICPITDLLPSVLRDAVLNTPYHQLLTINGSASPQTYAVTSGALPPGITLAANGALDGTPTVAGPYSFTITATETNSCAAAQPYSLTVVTGLAPRDVRAEGQSTSTILVRWTRPQRGETGFRIERSSDGGSTWGSVNIVGPDVTSHLDSGLAAQTLYHYRVVAFTGFESANSSMAAGMTFPQGPTKICAQATGPYHPRVFNVSVAHDGTRWAAVWSERSGGRLEDIRFQFLDNATGAPVGSPVQVTQTDMQTRFPMLRWNGTNFGVLYSESIRGPLGDIRSTTNFALLDAAGSVMRSGVRVHNSTGGLINSGLDLPFVWDGGGWGVFTTDSIGDATTDIYYRRLTPIGDLSGAAVRLTNTADWEQDVAAAWNGTEYGLLWVTRRDGVQKLFFQRMQLSGTLIGTPLLVDQGAVGELLFTPNILWNGEWALAWNYQAGEAIIRFRLLNPDGTPKSAMVRLSDDVPVDDEIPAIMPKAGGGYFVFTASLQTVNSTNYDLARLAADAAGNRSGTRVFLTPSDNSGTNVLRVATDGTRFLLGHDKLDGPIFNSGPSEAAVLIVDASGNAVGSAQTLTSGHAGGVSNNPVVVALGANFGMLWNEISNGSDTQVYGKFFDGGGNVTATRAPLSASTTVVGRVAAAAAGFNFGLAWRDTTGIRFGRFDSTGNPLIAGQVISNGNQPSLAWNGEHFGLATAEGQIRFQRLDNAGALVGPKVTVSSGSGAVPLVAWMDRGWGIVWRSSFSLFFALLDRNGAFDVPPLQVTFSGKVANNPAIAWSGDRLGIVWRENRGLDPPGDDIFFTALRLDGTKAFTEKVVGATQYNDTAPAIYWSGDRFRIVYGQGVAGTVEIAVMSDGTVVPGERVLHNRAVGMGVAFNGVTSGMAFNSLFDMTAQSSACLDDLTAPPCPNLTATFDGTAVHLTWPAVFDSESGIGGYNVYRDGAQLAELQASLAFDDRGFVSGTSHVYEVRAVNRAGRESSGCTTRTIVAGISVNPSTLPNGNVGGSYNATLSGSGGTGPYTFAVTAGALPGGIALSTAGVFSGVPNTGGLFNFTVTATDALAQTGARAYSIRICSGLTLFPFVLADGYLSVAYSQTLVPAGNSGTATMAVTSGTLPAGLVLDPTGWINGTPTAAGTSTFTITVTDSIGCTFARAYTIVIQTGSAARNLSVFPLGTTSIRLRWTDPHRNETGFRIERSTNLGASWSAIGIVGGDTTTYTDGSLAPATAYSYRVVATTPSGDAPPSNVGTASTWPAIAARTCVQQISNYHSFARSISVARSSTQWAMAYQDRTGGDDDEIFFRFLDASGAPAGSPVQITSNDTVSLRPTLRWNGSKFGLMWIESIRGAGGEFVNGNRFALLDASGAVIRKDVRIPTPDGEVALSSSELLWDGAAWGFFESHMTSDGLLDIFFYRLAEDGELLAGPVRVTSHADYDFLPNIAWNGSEYGMSWLRSRDDQSTILFQRVSASGVLVGSPTTLASGPALNLDTPDVVAVPSGWTVVWSESPDGEQQPMMLRRLDAAGAPLGPATRISDDFDLNGFTPADQQPAVDLEYELFALPAGGYAVFVRTISNNGRQDVGLLRADAAGNRVGARVIISPADGFISGTARAAFDGTNFLVGFNEGRLGTQEIADVLVSQSGATVAGPTDLTSGHSPGNSFGIVTSSQQQLAPVGGGFAALWNEPIPGDTQLYAKLFDGNGNLAATRFPLSTRPVRQRAATVGVGSTFAVAWRDATNNIAFCRYDASGNPLQSETTPLVGGVGGQALLLGFDGENYAIVWNAGSRLNFQRVAPNGTALGIRGTLPPLLTNAQMQMAWTGSGWAIVFVSNGDIHYTLVDAAGAVIVPAIRVSFTPDVNKESIAIAWNGDALGIAYTSRDATDPPDAVSNFTVVGLDGIKQFPETVISDGRFDTSVQGLSWTGTRFTLTYLAAEPGVLRRVELTPAGAVFGPATLLTNRGAASSVLWNGATFGVLWATLGELFFETSACVDDPALPACPAATASRTPAGVTLTWPAVPGAYRYLVYRDGSIISEATSTSYLDAGIRPADAHTYRVTTVNGAYRESTGCPTLSLLGVPSLLVATATSSTQVQLSWQPVAGATGYIIERTSDGTNYSTVGTPSSTTFTDTTALAGQAYLYRARATAPSQTSGPSNVDLATTIVFTDDPLLALMLIKSVHLTEARQAVDAVRALALLPPASYSNSGAAGSMIRAVDITELRAALAAARAALALPPAAFTGGVTVGGLVMTSHLQEVRVGVR